MRLWMDVMRHLEPLVDDPERHLDAWEAGGVDGLVVGPLAFGDGQAAFDPDPAVYRSFGVAMPPVPPDPDRVRRARLERALTLARDRGWLVWIFTPAAGAGPEGRGHWTDPRARAAHLARAVDALHQFPMAVGGVLDGPEWGYEITAEHMNHRSYLFHDLPESVAPACARLGRDYGRLCAAQDRLFERLHALSPARVERLAGGGWLGATLLFGADPDLVAWIRFRIDALTEYVREMREGLDAGLSPRRRLAMGPRSACFAPLCGYDLELLEPLLDVVLPKHYFWHRGFDGMYGTICRWEETLTSWNPGLPDAAALAVTRALFGLELPGVSDRRDFENGFPDEFYDRVVTRESRAALAAFGDPERVVPWVDAGRKPHDGDPYGAGELRRLLRAAAAAGIGRFIYHHSENLTPAEWTVISEECGERWEWRGAAYTPPDNRVL